MTKENSLGTLGRYKILEEIGRGGFSVVYKAENVALKKTVAIKMMLPALFHDPESIERFIHEARTVAGLKHAHITRVVDLDEDEGRLFMALEYLPGGDLHSWIETHGRPSFRQSAGIMYDIAEALDYAHGEGVVHGDVKPGNILLNEAGRAKLTDFGILRAVESSGVTSADMTRGTPYYVSPEGAEGGRPTPLSDQYALGVVAYELLTGQVPFGGDTPLSIYLKHVREEP
ncbi:MAG: serine/threonine protein kinase, partial [Anaerolineales bacterium]|nr:serine/threonine protein kinase [Anaerolineales bacterium]